MGVKLPGSPPAAPCQGTPAEIWSKCWFRHLISQAGWIECQICPVLSCLVLSCLVLSCLRPWQAASEYGELEEGALPDHALLGSLTLDRPHTGMQVH